MPKFALPLAASFWIALAAPVFAQEAEPASEIAGEETNPLIARGNALVQGLDRIRERVASLNRDRDEASGEDLVVVDHQIVEAKLDYLREVSNLIDNVLDQEREGLDATEIRKRVEADVPELGPSIARHIDEAREELSRLRDLREGVEGTALLSHEQRIEKHVDWIDALYQAYLDQIRHLDELGLSSAKERDDLAKRAADRANRLAGRLEVNDDRLSELQSRLKADPSSAAVQAEIQAVERRKESFISALSKLVDALDVLEIDSTEYRQALVVAEGQVTADVFRGRVALGLLEDWLDDARRWTRNNGLGFGFKLLLFALILGVFRVIAAVARRVVDRTFKRNEAQQSRLLRDMMLTLASRGILLLGVLVGLSQLGIELGPLLTGLGIAGFIVGFALQDSLANFAAGVMILAYRPFDVDDLIEAAGVFGRVSYMSLVSTTILTVDNQTLVVPNGKIWGDVIKNVTHQEVRRVDMTFPLAYDADVDRAESILNDVLASNGAVLKEPEPNVKLNAIKEGWVEIVARPWVNTEDYWDVYWYVLREAKRRFDEAGIAPGVPRRDVRVDHASEG